MDSLFAPVSPLACTICKKRTLWPIDSLFAVVCLLTCTICKKRNPMAHRKFVCSCLPTHVHSLQEKNPMACRKFVCSCLPTCMHNLQEKNLMRHTGFVCSYLVIMTLGDLDKQGDAISGKSPCGPILSEVLIDEKFVSKLAVLCQLLLDRSPPPDIKCFMLQLFCTSPSLG